MGGDVPDRMNPSGKELKGGRLGMFPVFAGYKHASPPSVSDVHFAKTQEGWLKPTSGIANHL